MTPYETMEIIKARKRRKTALTTAAYVLLFVLGVLTTMSSSAYLAWATCPREYTVMLGQIASTECVEGNPQKFRYNAIRRDWVVLVDVEEPELRKEGFE